MEWGCLKDTSRACPAPLGLLSPFLDNRSIRVSALGSTYFTCTGVGRTSFSLIAPPAEMASKVRTHCFSFVMENKSQKGEIYEVPMEQCTL